MSISRSSPDSPPPFAFLTRCPFFISSFKRMSRPAGARPHSVISTFNRCPACPRSPQIFLSSSSHPPLIFPPPPAPSSCAPSLTSALLCPTTRAWRVSAPPSNGARCAGCGTANKISERRHNNPQFHSQTPPLGVCYPAAHTVSRPSSPCPHRPPATPRCI